MSAPPDFKGGGAEQTRPSPRYPIESAKREAPSLLSGRTNLHIDAVIIAKFMNAADDFSGILLADLRFHGYKYCYK
jgi:hypothetical protein